MDVPGLVQRPPSQGLIFGSRLWCDTRVQGFESGGRVVIEVVGKLA